MSPEAYASYLSWLFFSWFNGVIKIGSTKTINLSDLPELLPQLRARTVWSQFQMFKNVRKSASLLKRVLIFNAVSFFWQFTFVVISTCLDFSVPYFLKLFLSYINDPTVPPKVAYLYIVLIFVAQVSRSLVQSQMFYMGRKINVSMMALLNAEIYAKTLTRRDMSGLVSKKTKSDGKDKDGKGKGKDKGKDNAPASAGKVVNLMSTDTVRVSGVCNFWHIGVSSPIGIALGTYLLYDLIGWSSLVGMSILVITIPVNKAVRKRYAKGQRELSSARDDRVTLMGELIAGIRMIKFFAWELSFSEKVLKAREIELKKLVNVYKNTILFQLVWFSSPLLVTLSSFFCYAKIQKGEFTPAVAFTAMVLFTRLKAPLNGLPAVYMALTNASVSLGRIAEYLDEPNIKDVFVNGQKLSENSPQIGMKGLTAQWWTSESAKTPEANATGATEARTEDTDTFTLRNITVAFPVGELSIVCGPTGGGKTSLLLGMLGEMDVLSGEIYLPRRPLDGSKEFDPETGLLNDGVAYVSQQAWLQNASIRDNILFGSVYEEERYNQVIEVCALKRDLEILEDGDQTEIGEKGITLSGGQKQRVSLARAIYSRSRHVLLDDCLSAVDAHTAEHIHEKCLIGPIMKNRTCILVTHHVRLCISTAKHVVLVNNGEIVVQGSVQHLREQGSLSLVLDEDEEQSADSSDADTVNENDLGSSSAIANTPKPVRRKSIAKDLKDTQQPVAPAKDARKLVLDETREEGRVKWSIYKVYASAAGGIAFWFILMVAFVITRMVEVSESLWVREWANSYAPALVKFMFSNIYSVLGFSTSHLASSAIYSDSQGYQTQPSLYDPAQSVTNNTDYYLFIYAMISIGASLAHIMQTVIVLYGSLRAARSLYRKLLMSVVRAPLRFFDTTPVGRIMNRFSNDFETVDGSIAGNCSQLLQLIMSASSIIIVLAYITPLFVVVAALISVAYLSVGKKYISSSRELKRLHSVSRSPIYSTFGETLAGVATIRAFSEQSRFMGDLLTKLDDSNRPFYFLWIANRWLSVRSDSIGALVALSSGIFILMNPIGIDAGTAGLALTYALEFVALVNFLVREYTQIEMELNSIERITEYTVMAQEPPAVIEGRRPPAAWPTGGSIEVKDLEMKYAPELETVLRGISFTVESRQKIGVVGRTGSGKSTLALSLFRFVEPVGGSIHVDGINICDIGLDDLRSRLTIIPQDPMLFTGTIRSNLDPFSDHVDSELWEALQRVHLVGSGQDSSAVSVHDGDDSNNASTSSPTAAGPSTAAGMTGGKTHVSFSSLDNPVSEGGSNFSQGQRQLLCMARALLRNSKIIVMDEATASVDFATDKAIQSAIQQEFENSTVICIAHRLNTIILYDKVLVLDHGKVLEYDTPANLLDDSNGRKTHFREMCERSGELEVLLEMVRSAENKKRAV
ncbi:P-loop containing nucleoside triphosphate hydrolase protein [Gamsiella multidivaricata]|uniref:P-loop containing nucleoside triphosphate hydrolase protein n=1 Tax=Gamsiella multidivaricata TaxID=101098 RepID=UPI00221EB7CD|nr:P-loop containing nucleoside triphosphate hydrolase protein [Gamsiella multidivaricata]KAI7817497.1 P-loop containing nucleoside triphosphate hydrolase protein [Gamsiella multidivaricata]